MKIIHLFLPHTLPGSLEWSFNENLWLLFIIPILLKIIAWLTSVAVLNVVKKKEPAVKPKLYSVSEFRKTIFCPLNFIFDDSLNVLQYYIKSTLY